MPISAPLVRPRQLHLAQNALLVVATALIGFAAAPRAHAQASLPTGFRDSLIVGGLNNPVGMEFLDDGRLLVVEQRTARIRLIVNGALAATDPVLIVPEVQTAGCEQGLLGIALDPAFPTVPHVYILCDNLGTQTLRITRYTVGGDLDFTGNGALTISSGTRRDILTGMPDINCNHNGGTLRFGNDGMLYASFGEDAQRCLAQSKGSLAGVILRLNVSTVPAGGGTAPSLATITPADNPFIGDPSPNARMVWTYGLRNPFRFHIDPDDNALFIGDVGENTYEEVDRVPGGGLNLGWPLREGPQTLSASCTLADTPTAPIHYYDRTEQGGASVISAGVYRLPPTATLSFGANYVGDYFFSDYSAGFLRRIKRTGNTWAIPAQVPGQGNATNWATGLFQVSDYLVARDGSLWYCRQGVNYANNTGQIRAIVPAESLVLPVPPPVPVPAAYFSRPFPSPATHDVSFRYALSRDARVSLTLYDSRGRMVRQLVSSSSQAPNTYTTMWDGLDEGGRRVPSGVYFAQLVVDGERFDQRVALVR